MAKSQNKKNSTQKTAGKKLLKPEKYPLLSSYLPYILYNKVAPFDINLDLIGKKYAQSFESSLQELCKKELLIDSDIQSFTKTFEDLIIKSDKKGKGFAGKRLELK